MRCSILDRRRYDPSAAANEVCAVEVMLLKRKVLGSAGIIPARLEPVEVTSGQDNKRLGGLLAALDNC